MKTYSIRQTDEAVNKQLDRAMEAEEEGSQYPGMSYEQGVLVTLQWLLEGHVMDVGEPIEERDDL